MAVCAVISTPPAAGLPGRGRVPARGQRRVPRQRVTVDQFQLRWRGGPRAGRRRPVDLAELGGQAGPAGRGRAERQPVAAEVAGELAGHLAELARGQDAADPGGARQGGREAGPVGVRRHGRGQRRDPAEGAPERVGADAEGHPRPGQCQAGTAQDQDGQGEVAGHGRAAPGPDGREPPHAGHPDPAVRRLAAGSARRAAATAASTAGSSAMKAASGRAWDHANSVRAGGTGGVAAGVRMTAGTSRMVTMTAQGQAGHGGRQAAASVPAGRAARPGPVA